MALVRAQLIAERLEARDAAARGHDAVAVAHGATSNGSAKASGGACDEPHTHRSKKMCAGGQREV